MFYKLVCVVLLSSGVFGAVQLPPEIKRCSKSDPNFSECMCKSMVDAMMFFKDGYKDFGLPRIQPFYIERLEIAADPGKSVKLNQKYDNIYFHGIDSAQVKKFKLTDDGKNCKWEMEIYNPSARMEADYTLTGQVILFSINGQGKCNVTMEGITNKHVAECEHYMKKGKSHMRLKNYTIAMTVEKCHFDFPDIIRGNEQISKELGKTLNENSLEILEDVKGGFEELLSRLHMNAANSVFSKIPEDELFLP